MKYDTLARSLGWFGIALGLFEILAPRKTAALMGTDRHPELLPPLGVREIASGVGILAQRNPTPWMWARVAGDAIDLAVLVAALGRSRTRGRLITTIVAIADITAVDALCAARLSAGRDLATARARRRVDYAA